MVLLTGVLRAVRELNVDVPGHLSVVGCDDFALAQLHRPAITVLERDAHLMGRTAAVRLVEDIGREEPEPLQVTLGTNLTVRESTGSGLPPAATIGQELGMSGQRILGEDFP